MPSTLGMHRSTLAHGLIDDGEQFVAVSPDQSVLNKVHTPDVVQIQGTNAIEEY